MKIQLKCNIFATYKNFQTGHVSYFAKHETTKLCAFPRSLVHFQVKNVSFQAKNVHYRFVKNFIMFFKNFVIMKIAICFNSFNNFKTCHVLYFAKLQNTKIIVFCRALAVVAPIHFSFFQKNIYITDFIIRQGRLVT